jgi:hypothetical protein
LQRVLAHILEDVAYLLRVIAGSEWPSNLETVWSGTPCRKARVPAV